MATYTVTDDKISSPQAAAHLGYDARVMTGVRNTLEILGIPLPEWVKRKPPGRPPSRTILQALAADNPNQAPAPLTYKRHQPARPRA